MPHPALGPVGFSLMQNLIWPRMAIMAPDYYVKIGHILHNEKLSFIEGRNQVVHTLRQSEWIQTIPDWDPVHLMIEDLADAKTPIEFIAQFDVIRDQADYHRCQVDVISV